MEISLLNSAAVGGLNDTHGGGELVDVAARARQAFAEAVEQHGIENAQIVAAANDPRTASSPEAVIALQLKVAHHQMETVMATAFANHITKGVETLVKS